ncbi:hypothetical protein KNU35_gp189 [Escherichia phage vB_EcoM_005]|uniref:Glutaredoxin n=1 Tax=Escherichia phage vB_EcoM_005 TaxID=2500761 RepID=A0A3Q9R982_9CAUD|nr:hypothetical protein KNU35_gp189 [Escherichia phage vB_EcoM_005]AZV01042.1 hypothetical protein vBEcoM005_155 [Escherichia phage vB_EcoM_005]
MDQKLTKIEIYGIPETVMDDKPLIVSLAKRAGFKSLAIRYPVIFVDNKKIENIPAFKSLLIELGYDRDLIED